MKIKTGLMLVAWILSLAVAFFAGYAGSTWRTGAKIAGIQAQMDAENDRAEDHRDAVDASFAEVLNEIDHRCPAVVAAPAQ